MPACYSTLTDDWGTDCAVASYLARARLELLAVLSLDSAKADMRHPGRGRVSLVPKVASLASRCTIAPQVGACLRLQGGWAARAKASSRLDNAVVDAVCGTRALPGCTEAAGGPLLQCMARSGAAPGRQSPCTFDTRVDSNYHQLWPLHQEPTKQQSRQVAAGITCKDTGKMLCLPRICHIDDPVPLLVMQALLDGCHVCGSVPKAAVRFLDHQGRLPGLHITQEAEAT